MVKNLSDEQIKTKLIWQWENADGFFFKFRFGTFDKDECKKTLDIIEEIEFGRHNMIDRKIVDLIWFVPLFLEWNKERVIENGCASEYEISKVLNLFYEAVSRKLDYDLDGSSETLSEKS